MIQKPGIELPWSYEPDPYSSEQIRGPKGELVAHVIGYGEAAKETATYIVHVCNRFPEMEKALANAPKPRQDAGRVEYDGQTAQEWAEAWDRENDRWQAIVMHHEELETGVKKLLKFLKMRYPNMNTKFPGLPEVEKIMAQTGDNPALTLEAKPQTDNGGLVEAAKEIMKLNFKHRDFCRVDLHVSVDGGKCTCGVWAKLEKLNAALAQADAKEGNHG